MENELSYIDCQRDEILKLKEEIRAITKIYDLLIEEINLITQEKLMYKKHYEETMGLLERVLK